MQLLASNIQTYTIAYFEGYEIEFAHTSANFFSPNLIRDLFPHNSSKNLGLSVISFALKGFSALAIYFFV